MKKIFIIYLFFVFSLVKLSAQQKNTIKIISDVQIKNNWIIVFDTNGKYISQMPQSRNEVVGIAGSFFVITANGWIVTYDGKCKRIAQIPLSGKQVKGAAGDTFTVLSNGWIISYDKNCKEKSRRPK